MQQLMSGAHFINSNLQQYSCQVFLFIGKNTLCQINTHSVTLFCTHITVRVTLSQLSYTTSGPVSTGMGDPLQETILVYVTSHPGQLNLAILGSAQQEALLQQRGQRVCRAQLVYETGQYTGT